MFNQHYFNSQTWEQSKYSLTGEWITKMRYTYTMEYYSTILRKSNEIMPFTATYLDLEIVILNEISQKDKDRMMSLICGIQMKIFVKEKQTHRHKKNNLCLPKEEGVEGIN